MKKNNKIILSTLTSLVAPCAFIGVLSVGDNLRTDGKIPTNLVGVDSTISEAIPITNHITDKRNIGSFWTAPTANDVINKINQLKGQTGISADLKINEIYVQTLPTPSGTSNVTAVIGVVEWSEYYQTDSTTNVIYNVNPETFKTNLSNVVTGDNRWALHTDDANVFNDFPTADQLWPLIMAKNPNLNWNQLYLDMSNQKTQQAGGGCYVYLKPIAGSTQYTGSVQIFYGINIFQSAGFTVVGDPTGYTTDDDNGVLTFTKSGTYEVSNNYLPDSTTQISKHRIVINNCEVEIKFSGDITMNNGTPISMTGTKPVTHLYSDQDATINCTSTSGPGMQVSGGQTLILDGAGTYATVGASISPGIGANGSWGEIQIIGDCSVTASHPSSTNTYPLASIGGKSGTMGQSKIWINTSGVIKAYGVDDYYTHGCAAIGAGANNNAGACWGTIIIDNGTVYAYGLGRGAGIGTGTNSYSNASGVLNIDYGVIEINGGSVHAAGGNKVNRDQNAYGAGLGFGALRAVNDAEITGTFSIVINGGTHYISGYGGCDDIGFGVNMNYTNKEAKRAEFIKYNGGTINPFS